MLGTDETFVQFTHKQDCTVLFSSTYTYLVVILALQNWKSVVIKAYQMVDKLTNAYDTYSRVTNWKEKQT